MPTLKEVLADKAKYPDNLVWNLEGGVGVTLAQLRSLDTESQAATTKREKDLEAQRLAVLAKDEEVKRAQTNTANLYVALQKAQQAIADGKFNDLPEDVKKLFGNVVPANGNNNNNNDPFAALSRLETDTLLGPVVKAMRQVAEDAKKAQDAVAGNIKVQQAMATNYMNGVLVDRYERIVPADKQDKISLKSLIEDAVRNNEYSADTVPDIRRAYQRATAADKQAEHDAAVAATAVKKYQEEHPIGGGAPGTGGEIFIPQGSNFGLDVHNRSGKAIQPFKNLDEAFAAAAKDKDIWSQVDSQVQ